MEVKLDAFEGPLDLLLHLIRRAEMDIFDIPIAVLTAQYMDAIADLPPEMEQMSEFLVMAATLLEIKSRMLLPSPKKEAEPEEDPREALVQKLLAHERAQVLADQLLRLTPAGDRLTGMGEHALMAAFAPEPPTLTDAHTLSAIWSLFEEVLSRRENRRDTIRAEYGRVMKERFTVPEKIIMLKRQLHEDGRFSLLQAFMDCHSRAEMIVAFLAVLELMRQGAIRVRQERAFADVVCEGAA